ncbi:uncharacterized protein LOC143200014 [Rhynchophorus ferrugineus]|uniref:uncharacterized protein LOC143200014 n=1 Tax=Rhynchophorus ferrugineus TaxID=354439 RepID=UPI003FCE85F1
MKVLIFFAILTIVTARENSRHDRKYENTAAIVREVLKQLSQGKDSSTSSPINSFRSGDKSFTGQSPHFSYSPTRQLLQETDKERPDSYDLLKQNQAGGILQLRQDPRWKQDQPDDIGFELQRTIKVGNRAQSARQQLWNLRPDSGDPGRYNARYIPEVQQLIAETNIHQTKRAIEQAQTNVKQLQLQRQFINRQLEIIQTLHETGIQPQHLQDLSIATRLLQQQGVNLLDQELRQLRTVQQLQQVLIEQESEMTQRTVSQQWI